AAAPAPTPPTPVSPPPTPPVSVDDLFSLDLGETPKPAPAEPPAMAARAQPTPVVTPAKPIGSGPVSTPAARPETAPKSGVTPAAAVREEPAAPAREPLTAVKPAKNGRPAIRITFVRPGEKSPLAGQG